MSNPVNLPAVALSFCVFSHALAQADGLGDLAEMRAQIAELRSDADRPLQKFYVDYEGELEKLSTKAKKDGNLDLAIAIRDEKANFKKGTEPATHPDLLRLQKIFADETARLMAERRANLIVLLTGYKKNLIDLRIRLTKAAKLDEAVAVQQEIDAIALEPEDPAAPSASAAVADATDKLGESAIVLSDLRPMGACDIAAVADGLLLTSAASSNIWAATPKSYSPPFRVTVVAKTDSTNIRMKYAKGLLIFNWELNQSELKVRDPKTGQLKGIKGVGEISKNEWHTFLWEIRKDGLTVSVDGEERYVSPGEFGDLSSQFGIGPAFKSEVTVKSLEIDPG